MTQQHDRHLARHTLLAAGGATGAPALTPALDATADAAAREPGTGTGAVGRLPADVQRPWLGPDFWANRLQDRRPAGGRIESVAPPGPHRLRTVAVLTRELTGDRPARLRVRTGTLVPGPGFSGFLIGTTEHTGDLTDGFGTRPRVLAVANPRVSFADYRAGYPTGQGVGESSLKREGYGIVRVDPAARAFTLGSWPWDGHPHDRETRQFDGWPVRPPFDDV
ncbi:hypothetical protein DMB38_25540 [Streptomyces sp. WAC 06738]|uniref:hypothetical protein n=1 Tax=Streptomyces sp. WAC 06738 TaxID=2203210 RepID=UPI000F6B5251|nr:hypothetical protein [Streptomyces sp. WAC 06738]AZM48704.1 hypothetical protein DMB38_25540 [Streptomyces sp. WAC 06738]